MTLSILLSNCEAIASWRHKHEFREGKKDLLMSQKYLTKVPTVFFYTINNISNKSNMSFYTNFLELNGLKCYHYSLFINNLVWSYIIWIKNGNLRKYPLVSDSIWKGWWDEHNVSNIEWLCEKMHTRVKSWMASTMSLTTNNGVNHHDSFGLWMQLWLGCLLVHHEHPNFIITKEICQTN